jgi:23S rRNA (adenine2503-C2)-methyltransferase
LELEQQFARWGQPAYRAVQTLDWIYRRRVSSWAAMTDLPKLLREQLAGCFSLNTLQLVRTQGSGDATLKFLWRLSDGALIESVLLPASPALYGEPSDRSTLCVSTQVGCAYGCKFCASGLKGWKRNLRADEIVDQIVAAERWIEAKETSSSPTIGDASSITSEQAALAPEQGAGTSIPARLNRATLRLISNLVIMGMGEPLANYDNLLRALQILNAPWGAGVGARKITISTSGLAPEIRRLALEPQQFRLAISLHGATDDVRSRIMPINRKYPLAELTASCAYYQRHKARMITFEYILIQGVNDSLNQIKPLSALARKLNAKVNLIPYNEVAGLPWQRPTQPAQEAFLAALQAHNVSATLRREKGHEIQAACGQLRLQAEGELAQQRELPGAGAGWSAAADD